MRIVAFVASAAIGMCLFAAVGGAVPTVVPYAGLLTFDTGVAYDGTVDVVVVAYDLPVGGQILWGPETHGNTPVNNGLFSLLLGSNGASVNAAFLSNASPYLEFELGGTTLAGRQAVGSVPFALRAADAEALGGTAAAEFATTASVAALAVGAVETAGGLSLSGALDLNEHPPADFRFAPAASAPVTCDANRVGYAYFDTVSKDVQVCDGTAFVALGSGTSGGETGGGPSEGTLVPGNTTLEVAFEGVAARCRQWSGNACEIAEINPTGASWFTPSGPNHLDSWFMLQNMESYAAPGYSWFCRYATEGNGAGSHTGGPVTVPNTAKYAWIQGTNWTNPQDDATRYYKSSGTVPNQTAGMAFQLDIFEVNYQSTSIICDGWQ